MNIENTRSNDSTPNSGHMCDTLTLSLRYCWLLLFWPICGKVWRLKISEEKFENVQKIIGIVGKCTSNTNDQQLLMINIHIKVKREQTRFYSFLTFSIGFDTELDDLCLKYFFILGDYPLKNSYSDGSDVTELLQYHFISQLRYNW